MAFYFNETLWKEGNASTSKNCVSLVDIKEISIIFKLITITKSGILICVYINHQKQKME